MTAEARCFSSESDLVSRVLPQAMRGSRTWCRTLTRRRAKCSRSPFLCPRCEVSNPDAVPHRAARSSRSRL
eukprot:2168186-Rhodomonas_salina.1